MEYLHRPLISLLFSLLLLGCAAQDQTPDQAPEVPTVPNGVTSAAAITAALAAQPSAVQARYTARNPEQTLKFFEIEPGMTIVEALPGGGWYSKILLSVLGPDGQLVGVNYAADMWTLFPNMSEERLAALANWTTTWTADAQAWRDDNSAGVSAFVFGGMSEAQRGTADRVLFIRALHNMARFDQRPFLTEAMQTAFDVLKPGGIAGIVQHEAPADASDEWANGSRGYLKRSRVITQMESVGFEFVGASDINQNPADNPGADDIVWRLPPSLATSRDNETLKAQMQAIGESNRMTLKFRKPT